MLMSKSCTNLEQRYNHADEYFTNLVIKHGEFIRNFIAKKVWDKQDIDDIYQITLLEAFRSFKNFRGDSHPRTWFCGIAVIVFKNYLRKKNKNIEQVFELLDDINVSSEDACTMARGESLESPVKHYEYELLLNSVRSAISTLPDNIKHVYVMVTFKGLDYENTAQAFGIPIGTVRSRVSRARMRLRKTCLGDAIT